MHSGGLHSVPGLRGSGSGHTSPVPTSSRARARAFAICAHTPAPFPHLTVPQGASTCRQIHAALQRQFRDDHMAANKKLPVADLKQHPEHAAKQEAEHQSLPDKDKRPNRATCRWVCIRQHK